MIAWSIDAAIQAGCFDEVLVSTDDDEIAKVAREVGASTPFRRPAELSGDDVGTRPVIRHAIGWLSDAGRAVEVLACVYATAAFLRAEDLREAVELFASSDAEFVVSVGAYPHPIERALRIDDDGRLTMADPTTMSTRTQDLAPAFHDAAQFYIGAPAAFMSDIPALSRAAKSFVLPPYRVQDIDTEDDWIRAEIAFRALQELGR